MSAAEEAFAEAWARIAPPGGEAERECRFDATRKWRFDFAWPALKIAVEIQGRGRHQTVIGERCDYEKHRAAVMQGWKVLFYPASDALHHADEWAREVLDLMLAQ